MAGMICPTCGQENPVQNEFCLKCGSSLTAKCRRCGTENPLAAEFCGKCGIKLATATPGIPFERVAVWQGIFREIGWLEESKKLAEASNVVTTQLGAEPVIERQEPTLFFVPLANKPWFPKELRINGRKARAGKHVNALWATNCRLFVLVTEWGSLEEGFWMFPFTEFNNWETDYRGRISLSTRRGDQIEIFVRLKKAGWFDVLTAAFASDPVTRLTASTEGRRKKQASHQFMDALALFVKDMVAVGS